MGSMFKAPSLPPLPTPPPVPSVSDARAQQSQADVLRARKGRASTIATGSAGLLNAPNVGTAKLLGG